MNFSLVLNGAGWRTATRITKGTTLQRGKNTEFSRIMDDAGSIDEQFGCYSWGTESHVYYCGLFAKDYAHGSHKTNFQARIRQYLANHNLKPNGRQNTNLMVFEHVNALLQQEDVLLRTLTFESLQLGEKHYSFADYSKEARLVRAVEELLICSYREMKQCDWNRT